METVSSFVIIPLESEPEGRFNKICPFPPQLEQTEDVCILPNIVLVIFNTCPLPLQAEQDPYCTPGAWTFLGTFIFFSIPFAISSKVNLTRIRILEPCDCL